MRCKSCDYPLWNLRERTCPECGTGFRPSEHEFVAGSVQFHCPECDQMYYGTDECGHLVPRTFVCVRCRRDIEMDEMVLRPGSQAAEQQPHALPWTRPTFPARCIGFFTTIGLALFNPARIGRGIAQHRSDGEVGTAMIFAAIVLAPTLIIGAVLPYIVQVDPVTPLIWPEDHIDAGLMLLGTCLATAGLVLGWAAATHLLLRMTGPCQRGLDGTIQAIAYGAGASVIGALPCIGPLLGWLWWAISGSIILVRVQGVSVTRAMTAVLIPATLFVTFVVGSLVVPTIWYLYYANDDWAGGGDSYAQFETSEVTASVLQYALSHGNRGPGHACELAGVIDVVASDTETFYNEVTIGAVDLQTFDTMGWMERAELIRETLSALPEGLVAHRLGDYVFTYHGIDLANDDPGLWIVVLIEDPDARDTPAGKLDPVHIGLLDGSVEPIARADLAAALEEQNALRAQGGLPSLPSPATIRQGEPVTADAALPD